MSYDSASELTFDQKRSSCPLCASSSLKKKYDIRRNLIEFSVSQCSECSFICMDPPLSDTALAALYSKEYYSGKANYSYVDERKSEKYYNYVWKARIDKIRRYALHGNFLDIGCSFGGLLAAASPYFTPFGIELSPYSAQYAARKGYTIHMGDIFNHPFDKNFFSVITAVELIEHIKEPVLFLKEVYSLLQEKGIFLVQTADMNAWQAKDAGASYHYYLPGHLSYFTQHNLTEALYQVGFKQIKVHRPVDFGLLPKLLKMRASFNSLKDYLRWVSTSMYHFKGYLRWKGLPLTSSMVIYAQK